MNYFTDANMVGLVLFGILSYATIINGDDLIKPILGITTNAIDGIIDVLLTDSSPPDPPIQGTTGDLIDATIKVDVSPDIIQTTTDNPGDTSTTGSSIPILPISVTTDPIIGPIITSIPIPSTNNNNSPGSEIPINPRAYYGSGTCCPQLNPLPAPIGKVSWSHVTIVVH